MSFADFKKIAEQPAERATQSNNARNVPLKVVSYDIEKKTVTGVDLYTNEEMTIALRPDQGAETREFKRSEIKDFAGKGKEGKRAKTYTEEGGVLLMDMVYADPKAEGQLTAKWARPYSHDADQAEVFVAFAAPHVSAKGKFAMDVLRTVAAAPVQTIDELRSAVIDALHNSFAGAVIRISDGKETVIYTQGYQDRIGRSKKVGDKFPTVSAEEAFDDFLLTNFGKAISKSLGNPSDTSMQDFTAEVIPVERIFAGKDTQAQMKSKENFEAFHKMGSSVGFTETAIAIRRHEEGGAFLAARPMPVHLRSNLYMLKDVPTANIRSMVQPFVNNGGEVNDEPVSDVDMESASAPAANNEISNKIARAASAMR